jgi:O-antigen/teichoic acid export membrane protein
MPSEDIGLATGIISLVMLITSISRIGLDSVTIRFLPKHENKNLVFNTVTTIPLLFSLILSVITLIGIDFFSPTLSFIKNGWFVLIFISYVLLYSLSLSQNNALLALRRGGLYLLQNLIMNLRLPLLLIMMSVFGIFLSYDIVLLITCTFGAIVLAKEGLNYKFGIDKKIVKETMYYSFGNYTANIFTLLPSTIIPIMIINLLGTKENAYFYVAYTIASILFWIPLSISMSLFIEGAHDMPIKRNVIKSFKFIYILILPALLFIFIFGDQMLMLFGAEYGQHAFVMLKVLALSSIFSAIISVYNSIKKVEKDVKIINLINSATCILILSLGYLFVQYFGLNGLGYAWLISNFIVCIMIGLICVLQKNNKIIKS